MSTEKPKRRRTSGRGSSSRADERSADEEAVTPAPPGDAAEARERAARKAEKFDEGCGCGDCAQIDEPTDDALVADIDPECAPAGLTFYRGMLQRDKENDELWRLYTTLELNEYLLLREDQIIAQRPYGDQSVVWVRRDRPVKRVVVRTPDQERLDRLEGEILGLWKGAAQDARRAPGGPNVGPLSMDVWPCPASNPKTRCGYC